MYNFIKIILFASIVFNPLLSMEEELENLIWIQEGDLPIIITAPHGGSFEFQGIPRRTKGTKVKDLRTLELAKTLNENLTKILSGKPYIVASNISRKFIDFNREKNLALEHYELEKFYNFYHGRLANFVKKIKAQYKSGILIDIHGQGTDSDIIFWGTKNKKTIKHLNRKFESLEYCNNKSLQRSLEINGYNVFPSSKDSSYIEDPRYDGGYTVQTYGSHNEEGIDAIQLEIGIAMRSDKERDKFCQDLAESLAIFYKEYYLQ